MGELYLALGGGAVADILLWKKRHQSVFVLISSTLIWLIFEKAGCNLPAFIAHILFFFVIILFFWAKSAALLDRPMPPLPNLEVSEEVVVKAADETRICINHALSIAHDIAICGDLKLFWQVAIALWLISYIGSLFNFLTLVYIGVLLSLTIPVFYDKNQYLIDDKLNAAYRIAQNVLGNT